MNHLQACADKCKSKQDGRRGSAGRTKRGTARRACFGFAGRSARAGQRCIAHRPGFEQRAVINTQRRLASGSAVSPLSVMQNTTLAVVATDAALTKAQARKVAAMAHDGLARAIRPIHTMFDGDTIFALSTGSARVDVTTVGAIAAEVVARAVLRVGRMSGTR